MIVRDINIESPMCNTHCHQIHNFALLKELIEKYELWINNDIDFLVLPEIWQTTILKLALTSSDLGSLQVWEIPKNIFCC